MTALEACTLLTDLTRELAAVRAEAHSYRLVAVAGIHEVHRLQLENTKLRQSRDRSLSELRDIRKNTAGGAADITRAKATSGRTHADLTSSTRARAA